MADRTWLALVDEPADDATAIAPAAEEGATVGYLAAWVRRAKPRRGALRAAPRLIDPHGEPAWASLVLVPQGLRLPFDDLAVQQARRRALAEQPGPDAISALLRDASHFEGSITVRRGPDAPARLRDDPFASVFPARVLEVGGGLLGTSRPPVGPVIERYGSANPWPADMFDGDRQ